MTQLIIVGGGRALLRFAEVLGITIETVPNETAAVRKADLTKDPIVVLTGNPQNTSLLNMAKLGRLSIYTFSRPIRDLDLNKLRHIIHVKTNIDPTLF